MWCENIYFQYGQTVYDICSTKKILPIVGTVSMAKIP